MTKPRCFISYGWESNEHKDWVRTLAEELMRNGVETFLDQWDIQLGSDIPEYMETCVRKSDFVILVCTPVFAAKANTGKGGVGYEKHIVTGEIYWGTGSPSKFIPLLRKGNQQQSLPSYLKSKNYIDFRNDNEFDSKLEELLRHMYKSPKYTRPPLGRQPSFAAQANGPLTPLNPAKQKTEPNIVVAIKEVSRYASSYAGMFLSATKAKEFTEWWVEHCAERDFKEFKEVYSYASSYSGIFFSNAEAVEFAKSWMTDYAGKDFGRFKELFSHASSYSGMFLPRNEAVQFALNILKKTK